jgi:hypothetical protein
MEPSHGTVFPAKNATGGFQSIHVGSIGRPMRKKQQTRLRWDDRVIETGI